MRLDSPAAQQAARDVTRVSTNRIIRAADADGRVRTRSFGPPSAPRASACAPRQPTMKIEGAPTPAPAPTPSKAHPARSNGMKMTMSTGSTMTPRIHRKVIRTASKLHPGKLHPGKLHAVKRQPGKALPTKSILGHQHQYHQQMQNAGKIMTSRGKMLSRVPPLTRPVDSCDNSNDSGLGFDHMEMNLTPRNNCLRFSEHLETSWREDTQQLKNCKSDLKFDSDDANDNFNFHETATRSPKQLCTPTTYRNVISSGKATTPSVSRRKAVIPQPHPLEPINLCSQLPSHSRDGRFYLQIVCQPEQQHRARYQTEGSRGAVKDRSGNGFPIVKLVGYDKPATLQVFIGTDVGRVAPHMFYQACRVFGKNSTPCTEVKEDGTVLIDIDFDAQKNWQVTCDCVGILKERNVDVEHRFGDQTAERGKKKSTRCRMVFRTQLINSEGVMETIQVCSQQIVCTQPPGVPEICRKSLVSCPASGGLELFLLGKNFLKDTKVVFQTTDECKPPQPTWEECVLPDKEFLQQNHLVCGVPPFIHLNISEPIAVKLFVVSGDKASESHEFFYTPISKNSTPQHATMHHSALGGMMNGQYSNVETKEESKPVLLWDSGTDVGMMLPPKAPLRRPSLILPDPHSPPLNNFKTEAEDSNQGTLMETESSEIISRHLRSGHFKIHNENSMDINDNSIDNDHMRTQQIPSDTVSRDANICMIPHSDKSNVTLIVNESTGDIMRISEAEPSVCLNENNVEMLIRHNDSTNVVKENNVNSYAQSTIMSPQLVTSQLMGEAIKNQINGSTVTCDLMNTARHMSQSELKVMDLRMKPENFVTENDNPSLATIHRFVDTRNKLPTQTAQSVENYLSNIDNKALLPQNIEKPPLSAFSQQLALHTHNTDKVMESVAAAIFHSTSEPNRANLYPTQSSVQQVVLPTVTPMDQLIVSKQMLTIPSNIMSGPLQDTCTKSEIYNSTCNHVNMTSDKLSTTHQSLMDSQIAGMDVLVPAMHASIIASPTSSTSKLDSLINSSVDSHLSPSHSESSPRHSPSSHDIILSAHSSPEIAINNNNNTQQIPQDLIHSHNTNALSPEVILNPQVSPTLMCSQDGALLNSQSLGSAMSQQLLPNSHNLNESSANNLIIMTNEQTNQSENMSLMSPQHMINPVVKTPPSTVECMYFNALVSSAMKSSILNSENVQSQPSLMCTQTATGTVNDIRQQSDQQSLRGPTSQYAANLPFSPQVSTEQYTSQAIIDNAVGNFVSQMKEDTTTETTAMNQAVTQAVSQAVSQAVVFSQVVNQAVNQKIKTAGSVPVRELTSISDNELLSYINPSCFDQV
ncbi:nuclear factor of activated T cells 3 [Arctopsyche grandis]|uniref:nuclear factor of activated T cells 3 n=1 Tax=Arctopsyche grandis TaxID=121162 RepID=UPI00406D9F50